MTMRLIVNDTTVYGTAEFVYTVIERRNIKGENEMRLLKETRVN